MQYEKELKKWFYSYLERFKSNDPYISEGIQLKVDHSIRVTEKIIEIGQALSLNDSLMNTAYKIGLLHDIGRFEQITKYGSFNDASTINHAELSVKILEAEKILDSLSDHEKRIILSSIKYHNLLVIPSEESDPDVVLFSKMIRDADKLDIFYLMTHDDGNFMFKRDVGTEKEAINPIIIDTILTCKSINRSKVPITNKTERIFMMVSFIFDLNYSCSFRYIKNNEIVENIFSSLSYYHDTELINKIYKHVMLYVQSRVNHCQ
jgi:hypothetical protein